MKCPVVVDDDGIAHGLDACLLGFEFWLGEDDTRTLCGQKPVGMVCTDGEFPGEWANPCPECVEAMENGDVNSD